MPQEQQKRIEYTYRGRIEVGTGEPGYKFRNGFSRTSEDGGILYPWMTYRDCQREARSLGGVAVFRDAEGRPWGGGA